MYPLLFWMLSCQIERIKTQPTEKKQPPNNPLSFLGCAVCWAVLPGEAGQQKWVLTRGAHRSARCQLGGVLPQSGLGRGVEILLAYFVSNGTQTASSSSSEVFKALQRGFP